MWFVYSLFIKNNNNDNVCTYFTVQTIINLLLCHIQDIKRKKKKNLLSYDYVSWWCWWLYSLYATENKVHSPVNVIFAIPSERLWEGSVKSSTQQTTEPGKSCGTMLTTQLRVPENCSQGQVNYIFVLKWTQEDLYPRRSRSLPWKSHSS